MRFIKITASLLVYASTAAAMRRAKPGLAAGLNFQLSVNDSKVWSYKAVERRLLDLIAVAECSAS